MSGGAPALVLLRGDCNNDGEVNISDASCTLNWLFLGARSPACEAAVNVNGDNAANISDASYLLNFLFLGGSPPPPPFPTCGSASLDSDATIGCSNSTCT